MVTQANALSVFRRTVAVIVVMVVGAIIEQSVLPDYQSTVSFLTGMLVGMIWAPIMAMGLR